ncbi:hypothetical protein H2200_010103 [Cladophialophora chaetospira]|uniref:DUF7908 domain-containing protein n=1 Tax=Cladophialophora chaetospira TaxID=386627 RepID=A0AA38X258_9EURO|nr:hypothetical protein H2200_010103 [Cladophialophora chaetospira]
MGLLRFTAALALAASAHSFSVPDTTATETLTRFVFTCPCDSTTSVSVGTVYPTSPADPSDAEAHGWHDWDGSESHASGALTLSSRPHSHATTWSQHRTSRIPSLDTTTPSFYQSIPTSAFWTSSSANRPGTRTVHSSESTTSTISKTTSSPVYVHPETTTSSAWSEPTSPTSSIPWTTTSAPVYDLSDTTTSTSWYDSTTSSSSITWTSTSTPAYITSSSSTTTTTSTVSSSGGSIQPGIPFLCNVNIGGNRLFRRDTRYLTIEDGAGVLVSGCNQAAQLTLSSEGALQRYGDGLILGAPQSSGLQLFEFISGLSSASLTDGWSVGEDGSLQHADVSFCMRSGGVVYVAFGTSVCDGTPFSLIATREGCVDSISIVTTTTTTDTSSSPILEASPVSTTTSSTLDTTTPVQETTPALADTTTTVSSTTAESECPSETLTTTLYKRGILEVRTLTVAAANCLATSSTTADYGATSTSTIDDQQSVPTTTPESTSTTTPGDDAASPADTSSTTTTSTIAEDDASLTSTTSMNTMTVTVTTSGSSSTTLTADTSSPTFGQPFSIQVNTGGPTKHKRDILVVGYVNGALVLVSSPADAVAFVLTSDGVLMIFGTSLVVGFGAGSGTSALMIYSSVSAMPTTIVWSLSGGALVLPGAGFCVNADNVMSVNVGTATDSSCTPVSAVSDTDTDSFNTDIASSVTPSPQTTTSTSLDLSSPTADVTSTTSDLSLPTADVSSTTPDSSSPTADDASATTSSSLTTTADITSSSPSTTSAVYISTTSSSIDADSIASESTMTTTTTTATKTEETSGPNCSILPLEDQTAPNGAQYTQFFYSCHAAIPETLGSSYTEATSGGEDYSSDPTAFLGECVANAEVLQADVWTYYQSSSDFKWHCGFWTDLVADDAIFVDDSTVFTMNAMKLVGADDTSSTITSSSTSPTASSTTTTSTVDSIPAATSSITTTTSPTSTNSMTTTSTSDATITTTSSDLDSPTSTMTTTSTSDLPTTTISTEVDSPTAASSFYIVAETGVPDRMFKRDTEYLALDPQTGLSSLVNSEAEASTFTIVDDDSFMVVVSGTPVWIGLTFTTPTQLVMETEQPSPPVTASIDSNGVLTISGVVTECIVDGGLVVSTDDSVPDGCILVTLQTVSANIAVPVDSSTTTSTSSTTSTTTTTTNSPTPTPVCNNGAVVTDANGDSWETLCGQGSYYGWSIFYSFSNVATLPDCIAKCNEDESCNAVSIEYRDAPDNNLCGFIYTSIDFQPYDFDTDTAIKISGANARPQIDVSDASSTTTTTSSSSTTTTSATSTTTTPACTPSAIGDITALSDSTQTFRNTFTGCGESFEGATPGGLGSFASQFAVNWLAAEDYEGWTFDQAMSRCAQFAVDNAATAIEFYVDVDQNWLCVGVDDVTVVDGASFYTDSHVVNVWGFVWENSCQNTPLDDLTASDGTVFSSFYTGCSSSFQGNTPGGLVNLPRVVSVNWQAPDYSGYTFDQAVQKCADTTVSQAGNVFEFYIGSDDWWYCVAVDDLPATATSFYPDATVGKVWGFAVTQSTSICEPSQLVGSIQLDNGTTYNEFYDACHVSIEGDTPGGAGWMTTSVFGFQNPPYDDGSYGGWTLETLVERCIQDSAAAGATTIEFYENADELPTWFCWGFKDVPAQEDSFYGDGNVNRLWAFKVDESTLSGIPLEDQ